MSSNNKNQRLNGFSPLSYAGQNASQPTNFTTSDSSPTVDDAREFNLGDWWLNTSNNTVWYLASTNGLTATWINAQASLSGLLTLKGNSGGPIPPELGNINVVGDGITINIVGNPGTSTLTASLIGGMVSGTLTGNSGGPVGPTAGNINILGSGVLSVAGNPGTSTLTITQSGAVASSFVTQAGTAVPVANILNVLGSNNISTSGAASTVTVTAGPAIAKSYITSPATATATPAAGVLTLAGAGTTTVSAAGSTITISNSSTPVVPYAEGTWSPTLTAGGVDTGASYQFRIGQYVRIGNVVFIWGHVSFFGSGTAGLGPLGIGGLPFIVSSLPGLGNTPGVALSIPSGFSSGGTSNSAAWFGQFVTGTQRFDLFKFSGGTIVAVGVGSTNVTLTSWRFAMNGFYFI